jgi:O-acetylserine/cysteine efflux transporter
MQMQPKDILLALVVVAVWGFNFVMIRIGLHDMPPILLCALRFLLCAFPAIFFFPRPRASWALLSAFGIFNFAFQFSFLFMGMKLGMPAGLASLVAQLQAFFTMALALWFFGEKPSAWKLSGAAISFIGIFLVGLHFQSGPSLIGLIFSLLAALSWAFGNIFTKKISAQSALALVVWGSLLACPFIFALSLAVDGPVLIAHSLRNISGSSLIALVYIAYISTYVGYSLWGILLNKYPTATVAPFSLLVPVFGFLGAFLFLGEDFPLWKIIASLVVILGLAFNVFEMKIKLWRRALPF